MVVMRVILQSHLSLLAGLAGWIDTVEMGPSLNDQHLCRRFRWNLCSVPYPIINQFYPHPASPIGLQDRKEMGLGSPFNCVLGLVLSLSWHITANLLVHIIYIHIHIFKFLKPPQNLKNILPDFQISSKRKRT